MRGEGAGEGLGGRLFDGRNDEIASAGEVLSSECKNSQCKGMKWFMSRSRLGDFGQALDSPG